MLDAAKRVDRLGYAHLWTWDHLYAIFGDPYQSIFEGWSLLAAWARETEQTRLGLLVGANTFRNPGVVAKTATTLDHVSNGRAILGIGGAWMEPEHRAHGIEFGTGLRPAPRLARRIGRGDADRARRRVGDLGWRGHYAFDDLRHLPGTIQQRLPIMIGGSGEKKTLRTVAKYADMWNAMGTLELMTHKVDVLRGHCDAVGRDIGEIEFTLGSRPRSATARPRRTASGRPPWPTTGRRSRTSRTTTRSGTAPPSRSPTGCDRMSTSASGP